MSALVPFGRTRLRVSRLCQGTAFRHLPRADDPRALAVLRHCLDVGINFFDSAHAYGWGGAEQVLGKAIAGRRSEVVLCTKVPASLPPEQPGEKSQPARFSRTYLRTQLEAGLRRLCTDYVDLYLLHQPDHHTPPEEVAAAMDELVGEGKIRYWGVSNHSAAQVQQYEGLGIAGIEDYYNISGVHQDERGRARVQVFEREMLPLLARTGLGCLAFSPMDTGHLAAEKPADARLVRLVRTLDEVAAALGVPRAAVCVAWVLSRPQISCALAGSESPEHVDANLLGSRLELPAEALAALDAARHAFRRLQMGEGDAEATP